MSYNVTKRAKILVGDELDSLFKHIDATSSDPLMDRVTFLLSFRAALRAKEIAGLEWRKHILTPKGRFDLRDGASGNKIAYLTVTGDIGKRSVGRVIPMAPDLYAALRDLHDRDGTGTFVIPSRKSGSAQNVKQRAHALAVRINRLYASGGFDGCTSHSGRRTVITTLSRRVHEAKGHLGDVQKLVGHAHLSTTEGYLEGSDAQERMVAMLM